MSFNPYHRWLGIRDDEQPPNHYRLLGIELLESDADVIASAADRQMAHVRRYQNGPHSAESQRLLNELAVAKLCLLDEQKRQAYDTSINQLRNIEEPKPSLATASGSPNHDAHRSQSAGPLEIQDSASARRAKPFGRWPLFAASLTAFLLAIFAIVQFLGRPTPEVKSAKRSDLDSAHHPSDLVDPVEQTTIPDEPLQPPNMTQDHDEVVMETGEDVTPVPPEAPANNGSAAEPVDPSDDAGETDPPKVDPSPPDSAAPDQPDSVRPDVQPKVSPKTTPLVLPPVPPEQELENTREKFEKAYAQQIDKALESDQPRLTDKLAGKFYQDAVRKESNLLATYVLLTKAIELAIHSGNGAIADEAADELTRQFDVDPVTVRVVAVDAVSAEISKMNKTQSSAASQRFCEVVMPMFELAIVRDDFEQAQRLLKKLAIAARRCRRDMPKHESNVVKSRELLLRRRREFDKVAAAKIRLQQLSDVQDAASPSHPDFVKANWTIGRYDALIKGDFVNGATYLIDSGHPQLAELSSMELAASINEVNDPQDIFKLAKGWLSFAERGKQLHGKKLTGDSQVSAYVRAQKWLNESVAVLSGIDQEEARQLLAKTTDWLEAKLTQGPTPGHAMAFDGRKSHAIAAGFRFHGKSPLVIETLVKPVGPTASFGTIGTIVGNAGDGVGFELSAVSGFWTFRFATVGKKDLMVRTKRRLEPDRWTRLVAIYDGNQVTLQQDDDSVIAVPAATRHEVSSKPLAIGVATGNSRNATAKNYLRGEIAELRIFTDLRRRTPKFELLPNSKSPRINSIEIETY